MSEENSTGTDAAVEEALQVARDVAGKDFDIDYVEEDVGEEPSGGSSPEEAMGGREAAKPEEGAETEPTGKPSQKIAAEKYRERAQKRAEQQAENSRLRQQLSASQQHQEELKAYLNVLLRRMTQNGQQQAQVSEESEEFPNVDPEVRSLFRHETDRVRKSFEETVQPFLQDREQLAQAQQAQAQQQQAQARAQALQQRLRAEEDEYRATELGEGYDERFSGFQESFRGLMSSLQEEFPHIADEAIQELEQMNLMGMVLLADRLGVPVPYFADAYMRSMGVASGEPAPPRRPPSAELSAARQAVEDGVGSGRRGHGSPPTDNELDIDLVMERGLTPQALAELIDGGGDWADRVVNFGNAVERRLG